ncbi:MAG: UDP-N-acetylmuramate--L-alanine ligase [Patescibacteria group bacterium]
MFLDQYSKVHCIGVGGIGISAVAKFLVVKGKDVSGSDAVASAIVDSVKMLLAKGLGGAKPVHQEIWIGSKPENISKEIDLIVYSEAVPADHPERVKAAELGIPQLGHFDFLGELSKEYRTICVTGTNGKSTTTAMTGKIFEEAGLDPTVFVGTLVPGWELGNLRVGASDILIIEGDEYKQKMVKLWPETTVITNIAEDHLDVYRDLEHIISTFAECADKTKGMVLLNRDDKNSMQLYSPQRRTFGRYATPVYYRVNERKVVPGGQEFVFDGPMNLGSIELKIPGEFNAYNAVAAAAVAREYDIHMTHIQKAMKAFPGVWRRFERVGEYRGAEIISDYGHHPDAIRGTIEAARELFPNRRIVLCFQPHQHSRTKALFADFVKSFTYADAVVLPEIYHVEGRNEEEGKISSQDLLDALQPTFDKPMFYAKDLDEAQRILEKEIQAGDVVLIMGAGNVDDLARKLVQ